MLWEFGCTIVFRLMKLQNLQPLSCMLAQIFVFVPLGGPLQPLQTSSSQYFISMNFASNGQWKIEKTTVGVINCCWISLHSHFKGIERTCLLLILLKRWRKLLKRSLTLLQLITGFQFTSLSSKLNWRELNFLMSRISILSGKGLKSGLH